jgi:DNA repair photolyase
MCDSDDFKLDLVPDQNRHRVIRPAETLNNAGIERNIAVGRLWPRRENNKMSKINKGFREWAKHSVNFCTGCSNNCRYCYAKGMAVRFGRLTPEQWPDEQIREKDVNKRRKAYDGRVMIPTSHDITPNNLDAGIRVIGNLLDAGNELLIVSKPRVGCIEAICNRFMDARDRILFRFTIGAMDDEILAFWEPGAPAYAERREALCIAHSLGFGTSVSVEPMLEIERIGALVADLEDFVSDSIWIGKMNHIKKAMRNVDEETQEAFADIEARQSDGQILAVYEQLKGHPKVKWKEGIKAIVGIEPALEDGMDI